MKYFLSTNQGKALKLGIRNINQAIIFDLLTTLSTWSTPEVMDGQVFYWAARQRIVDELPLLDLKPDTVYRHLKALDQLGLIEYRKLRKRDLVRVTEQGRSYVGNKSEFSDKHYVGNESESDENSDLNPRKLGNESENNSDLNPTDHDYQKTDPTGGGTGARAREAGGERPSPTARGTMSKALREKNVNVTPSNPELLSWIDEGASVELVLDAVEEARFVKPEPEKIPAAYLTPIVRRLLAGPKPRPQGQPPPQYRTHDGKHEARMNFWDQLNRGRHGRSSDTERVIDGQAERVD